MPHTNVLIPILKGQMDNVDIDITPEMAAELDENGNTPLHIIIENIEEQSALDGIDELLLKGCPVDRGNSRGTTPLQIAAMYGYTNIVSKLLEHGANPLTEDLMGITPLHCARTANIATRMIESFAEENRASVVNVCTGSNRTPLMVAAYFGRFEVVSVLLQNGAEPSWVDDEGHTALYSALSKWNSSETIQNNPILPTIINEYQVDCSTARSRGDYKKIADALIQAMQKTKSSEEICTLLREACTNINKIDFPVEHYLALKIDELNQASMSRERARQQEHRPGMRSVRIALTLVFMLLTLLSVGRWQWPRTQLATIRSRGQESASNAPRPYPPSTPGLHFDAHPNPRPQPPARHRDEQGSIVPEERRRPAFSPCGQPRR